MNKMVLVFASVLGLIACASSATTITVGPSGDYTEIQPALNAAGEGDTVLVAPGTYSGENNRNLSFGGVNIVLRSGGGAHATTIDCEGLERAFWFSSGEGPTSVVEGITVTNGYDYSGGAVYCGEASPTFIDCTFAGCSSEYGGAAYIWTASPAFTNCTFSDNEATGDGWGGAVYCQHCSSVFTGCTFSGNTTTHHGGAIYSDDSDLTLTDCTFSGNSAVGHGGGMFCTEDSDPSLTGCTFSGGYANIGGGISCVSGSSPTLADCLFTGHTGQCTAYADNSSPTFTECAFRDNAGSYCGGAYVYESTSQFTGCVFSGNTETTAHRGGGAVYCDYADPVFTNCTFAVNGGGGTIYVRESAPSFANCIVAHGVSGPAVDCDGGYTNDPTFSCCDVYGNAGGDWVGCIAGQDGIDDNMSADPLFCDIPGGDFTIDAASPCAAAHSPICGLIGALDVGCDSPVQSASWSSIKAMYK